MEYSKLVAVTGLPGLFELVSTKSDGAIIRSLEDQTTKFAATRIHNFSHLESIEVYTTGDNVNLVDVFHAMEAKGGSLPDTKDNAAVREYFEKVYPELDFERVYPSDLKKMVKWFEILVKHKIEIKLTEPEEEEEVEEAPAPVVKEEKKPAKKAAPAKEENEEEPTPKKKAAKETEEKKPVKKAAAKKKAEPEKKTPAKKKAAPKKGGKK